MRTVFQLLFFTVLSLASTKVFAQARYNVSGIVTNEKGEPLKSVTVFIGGSERVTATDEEGRFKFAGVPQGTFQLSVQMLGYSPETRNIIVKGAPIKIDIQLQAKAIALQQVTIGKKKAPEKNLKLFKEKFLGQSANAKECVITNPEVINFSTKKGQLLADADEFLVIENKRLGYRLRYLLGGFSYTHADGIIAYHGECSFEELDGTAEQKKQWAKNRLTTYQGSFMHFLRSVYANNTLENGFITRPVYGYGTVRYDNTTIQLHNRIIINDRPISFDSLLTAIDTNFTSLKFRQELYVIYDPKLAARFKPNTTNLQANIIIDPMGSVLRLTTNQAIIDKKGSYTDYHDFLSQGYWATARVGDQLPVEYKPPVAEIPSRVIATNPLLIFLQKWTDSIPQEKAYLHLDKPYYVPGDTIWFKGYLTTGSRHQLSPISGAVYVDLINEQNQPVKTLKLPVDSGTVAGDLILDDDVKAGSYSIRAYTQWMRNVGEDYFFNKVITVGDPRTLKDKINPKPSSQQTDVQFFPESGNLVNGIASRVGIKAVGANGLGVAISGTITDNENNGLAQINTSHAGMGVFLLKPLPGKNYIAHIKFADSTTKDIPLPMALNEGYVLNVYQPNKDSILVRIQASVALQHSTVNLIAHSSGEVIFTSQVAINDVMTSLWIDKKSFPSGIAQFTIFDTKNEPLNERIAFIKNNDYMQLAIKTNKALYKSKEHVQLELDAKGSEGTPVAANFSIAVIDESTVPVDESAESTIFSNILLTSDLKGYIENPNYYFTADSDKINKALDNLMLTQGYRRFEWKLLDSVVKAKPIFKAEGLTATISGLVTDLRHRALPNANVLLVSTNARINKATTADANGRFKFDKLLFADSAKFAVQARDAKNSDHAIIILDSIPKIKITAKQNFADINIIKANLQKAEDEGMSIKLTGHVLKQVNIKATRKKNDPEIASQGMLSLPDEESADKIIPMTHPELYPTVQIFLQTGISGFIWQADEHGHTKFTTSRKMVSLSNNKNEDEGNEIAPILNGSPSSFEEIEALEPEDIVKILVVKNNEAMKNLLRTGDKHPAGFIMFITKVPSGRKQYNPSIANISPKGFNKVRQFYSPHYNRPDSEGNKPDLRTTIYWNSYVNTDATGKATLDFYNADGPGTYRVVIEGINATGELGRQVYTYTVE